MRRTEVCACVGCVLYVIGTTLLVPSSVFLVMSSLDFPPSTYDRSIAGYVSATSFLVLAALSDLLAVCISRSAKGRGVTLLGSEGRSDGDCLRAEFNAHPLAGAIAMLIGGVLFLSGAVLYLRVFAFRPGPFGTKSLSDFGTWVFRLGSLSYLCGSALSVRNVLLAPSSDGCAAPHNPVVLPERRVGLIGTVMYILGALLFIAGGIMSQAGAGGLASGVAWLVGSLLFASGSFVFLTLTLRPYFRVM